ncbi:MAG: hypothetical protein WAK82_26065 [Streptosporangiaceae bacterium]
MNVQTRRAAPTDDRALAVLDAEAWPLELQVVPPQDAAEPFFGPRRAPQDVIVATLDGTVVGYADRPAHAHRVERARPALRGAGRRAGRPTAASPTTSGSPSR